MTGDRRAATAAPVLLVEDNPGDEALMREAFRRAGTGRPLVVARDGLEALALTLDVPSAARPALVILDLKLPHLSGLQVLARLRADTSAMLLPVIVLSSSSEPDDIRRSYDAGANSYLVKPVDFAGLEALVGRIASYWLRANEPPLATS